MDCTIKVLPKNKSFVAKKGDNLLLALALNGYFVTASCGGEGICGKCKVKLLSGTVSGTQKSDNGYVLSCKAVIESDLTVELLSANETAKTTQKIDKKSTYSVALDIGTTTLVASLINENTGKSVAKTSCLNPQGVLGADVLSRIKAYSDGNGEILNDLIVRKTQEILDGFTYGIDIEINELIVSANTTMLHIFLGVDPTPIGAYPFTPVFTESKVISGQSLGIKVKTVKLLPSASSYVGSDVMAGVFACKMHETDGVNLLVDVGTNGEIVLFCDGKMLATSTAAGPALEGAGIECGTGGVKGAIDSVTLKDSDLIFTTIDGAPVSGICGSGLIDAIALLVKEKIIDCNGTFDEESSSPLTKRLVDDKFYITDSVYISQRDIRQFQLAKSAIVSGIKTLLIERGLTVGSVNNIFLAGGLGQYMNITSAVETGLLPLGAKKVTKAVGNTALQGATLCVTDESALAKIQEIAKKVEIVELSTSLVFQDEYINNMYFGSEE